MANENQGLSGYHPVLSYALLAATKSVDKMLYRKIVRETSVSVDSVLSLISNRHPVKYLGDLPLRTIIGHINHSCDYNRIVSLAGMEAFHQLSNTVYALGTRHIKLTSLLPDVFEVRKCAELMRSLTTLSSVSVVQKGAMFSVELSLSPFVLGTSDVPKCGFYTSFLGTSVTELLSKSYSVDEVVCSAMDHYEGRCVFVLSPSIGEMKHKKR